MNTHMPGPLPFRGCHNPFRARDRRSQFAAMVSDYQLRNNALFRFPSGENRSNNIGEAFWRGFHSEGFIWSTATPLYVAYRAGQEIARATGAAP